MGLGLSRLSINSDLSLLQVPRTDWVLKWPGQVVIAGCQTYWTSDVSTALEEGNLPELYQKMLGQVREGGRGGREGKGREGGREEEKGRRGWAERREREGEEREEEKGRRGRVSGRGGRRGREGE